ncbi:hypothetical protein J6590_046684 [Homalodisca vitripennis]|nr:hypothetical protein J6590_046684 [Homalodisca vitripennis]
MPEAALFAMINDMSKAVWQWQGITHPSILPLPPTPSSTQRRFILSLGSSVDQGSYVPNFKLLGPFYRESSHIMADRRSDNNKMSRRPYLRNKRVGFREDLKGFCLGNSTVCKWQTRGCGFIAWDVCKVGRSAKQCFVSCTSFGRSCIIPHTSGSGRYLICVDLISKQN